MGVTGTSVSNRLHDARDALAHRAVGVGAHRSQDLAGRRQPDIGGDQGVFERLDALDVRRSCRVAAGAGVAPVASLQALADLLRGLRETGFESGKQ